MATLAPAAKQYFWNVTTGQPLAGGYVYTYLAGTSTPAPTYQDAAGSILNTNPIVLNSAGYGVIYFAAATAYKEVVTDGSAPFPADPTSIVGVVQWTQDNLAAVPPSAPNFDITGIAGEALAQTQCVYLSDGSGGKTAGRWYLADYGKTYSSVTPLIGFATVNVAAGAVGVYRLSGQLPMAGLVAGQRYFVQAPGVIVSAPPPGALQRLVGQADSTTDLVIAADPPNLNPVVDVGLCQGRLTLTSGQAVTTADVVAAPTIYWTPYKGNRIAVYEGATGLWQVFQFAEIPYPIPALSGAGTVFDLFAYNNNGAVGLTFTQWTNPTTRSVALVLQDGVLVSSANRDVRYLGTFVTTGTGTTTEDSTHNRYLSNYYNRVPRPLRATVAPSASWNYTLATPRIANGNAANQVAVVIGVAEVRVDLRVNVVLSNTLVGTYVQVGIGQDSFSTFDSTQIVGGQVTTAVAGGQLSLGASGGYVPTVGQHFYAWLEWSAPSGVTTWNNGSVNVLSGLVGTVDG